MSKRNPDWSKLQADAAKKRKGNSEVRPKSSNGKISAIVNRQELVVQRLSEELSGKTPKYSPIGPREFVPFHYEDVTLQEIQRACYDFFSETDQSLVGCECDVLATERGPSCKHVDQIPNLALVHVRFTRSTSSSGYNKPEKRPAKSKSLSLTKKKITPPSLTVSSMVRVGREINDNFSDIPIALKQFEIETMSWNAVGTITFSVHCVKLGSGGFRNVFEASSQSPPFSNKLWVMKRYKKKAKSNIEERGQTLEGHTKTSVQMMALADYFSSKLSNVDDRLPKFHYVTAFYGEIRIGGNEKEYVTIEEKLEGAFTKYLGNDGDCSGSAAEDAMEQKAQCLAHFSFICSQEKLLLTDIQGSGLLLTDPEIASSEFHVDNESLFCVGNICRRAIKTFGLTHKCNDFCKFAGLEEFDLEKFEEYDDTIELPDGNHI